MSPLRRLALVALATAMGMAPLASADYVGRHRAPVQVFASPTDVLAHRDLIRLAY